MREMYARDKDTPETFKGCMDMHKMRTIWRSKSNSIGFELCLLGAIAFATASYGRESRTMTKDEERVDWLER